MFDGKSQFLLIESLCLMVKISLFAHIIHMFDGTSQFLLI